MYAQHGETTSAGTEQNGPEQNKARNNMRVSAGDRQLKSTEHIQIIFQSLDEERSAGDRRDTGRMIGRG